MEAKLPKLSSIVAPLQQVQKVQVVIPVIDKGIKQLDTLPDYSKLTPKKDK